MSPKQPQATAGSTAKTRHRRNGRRRGPRRGTTAVPTAPPETEPSTAPPAAEQKPAGAPRKARRTAKKRAAPTQRLKATATVHKTGRFMVINVSKGEECRIAVVNDGKLEEIYFERQSNESHVGNIYKGVVTNVEPSIQAAFVDFGIGKNGFLHISDVRPQYFPGGKPKAETVGRKISLRDRPPIQRCLNRGDLVVVQVIKEGIGTKGPTLSTYLSIPGRYLVMMPGMSKLGVSRKIEGIEDRQDLRGILNELDLPAQMGFILRTAGLGRTKREFQSDLNYLKRLWKTVTQRTKTEEAPATLYQESDLVVRTMRDVLTSDFGGILVDDADTAERAREFLRIIMPRSTHLLEHYVGKQPLFQHFNLETAIEEIYTKHVALPSGGSLVVEPTEALVAIDVNSGRYREQNNPEATAFKINMEAAREIARQLRLRDLGGLIICDFIDMQEDTHKRQIEKALRDELNKHKERVQLLRMSQFGIIELTRQRRRSSIKRSLFEDCTFCQGSGLVKTPETVTLGVMRAIQSAIHHDQVRTLTVAVSPEVGFQLLNRKRAVITQLEEDLNKRIVITMASDRGRGFVEISGQDDRGRPVKLPALHAMVPIANPAVAPPSLT